MARSGAVNVYLKDCSPRAVWIFRLIIEDLMHMELILTGELPLANTGEFPLINYSDQVVPAALSITPHGLLSENRIQPQQVTVSSYEGLPVFFRTAGGDIPFDPFAMAFYLVSRYEEYLPFEADRHGRFPSTASLAYREGFLQMALVNRLAMLLQNRLEKKFPGTRFTQMQYTFVPTFDVDIAFAHLGKGLVRTFGAMAKLLLKAGFREAGRRLSTMMGRAPDSYDNFNMIREVCASYNLKPKYFILAGDPGPYDRNLSTGNRRFATLLKQLAGYADMGIHPSYGAGTNARRIRKELQRLSYATGNEISISRQHFVKLRFPETYDALVQAGIKEDYSMGYHDASGFRASIAAAYTHYDLAAGKEIPLTIHPFVFMDSSLDDYQGLKASQYAEAVGPLIEEVRHCRGTLIGIWHNYTLADDMQKHKAFKDIIKIAAEA